MKFQGKEVGTLEELHKLYDSIMNPLQSAELKEREPVQERYEEAVAPFKEKYNDLCRPAEDASLSELSIPYDEMEAACKKARDLANKRIEIARKKYDKAHKRVQKQFDKATAKFKKEMEKEIAEDVAIWDADMLAISNKYDAIFEPLVNEFRETEDYLMKIEDNPTE